MLKFNNVELTQETILLTRQHFADNAQGCIAEIIDGRVKMPSHVDLEEHFDYLRKRGIACLAGEWDHTFTFLQRAYWIQTGECIALLP